MVKVAYLDNNIMIIKEIQKLFLSLKDKTILSIYNPEKIKDEIFNSWFYDCFIINIDTINNLDEVLSCLNINLSNQQLVFTSTSPEQAVVAYDYDCIDFLLQPIKLERLKKTFQKLNIFPQETQFPKVYFKCFGGFELFINGEQIDIKNSKVKEILAFLVAKQGSSVDWMTIADSVWFNCYDDKKLMNNFHVANFHLRNFLKEHHISHIYEYSRNSYRLNTLYYSSDLYYLIDSYYKYELGEAITILDHELIHGDLFENLNYIWSFQMSERINKIRVSINSRMDKNKANTLQN